jgi:hypothetical protein
MLAMWPLFWPTVAFVGVSLTALLFRAALTNGLRRWLGPANVELFLRTIRLPSILWCLVLGLFVAIELVELPGSTRSWKPRSSCRRRSRSPACSARWRRRPASGARSASA